MSLQTNDKIILTGHTGNFYDTSYFAVARLNANGVIDSSFGTNGLTETNVDGQDYGHACVLQPDGKIILGGTNNKVHNYILARYNNNIQNKNPIARIKKWIEHHILHWQNLQAVDNVAYYTIEQSNNAASGFVQMAHIKKSETGNAKSEIYSYALPANTANSSTVNYYRINAVNNTGNIIASAIIEDIEDATISVYPNPVKDVLHIKGLDENAKYEVRLTNEKGNVFAKASLNKVASYDFNVQNLHRGIYYAAIISLSRKPVMIQFVKE